MTNQEIYNIVRKHLLTQNEKSQDVIEGRMQCAYRGPGRLKCAAGVLIPDTNYVKSLEGRGVSCFAVAAACGLEHTNYLGGLGVAAGDQINLAIDLQKCHDNHPIFEWRLQLDAIAIRFNLKVEDHTTP